MRPKEFCRSYQRLVQRDYGFEELKNQNTNGNAKKSQDFAGANEQYVSNNVFLKKINITCSAMADDDDILLPLTFPAVGSNLLEFKNALSDHMGWSKMVEHSI